MRHSRYPFSATNGATYDQVFGVLQQYMSHLNAHSLLNAALREARLRRHELTPRNLRSVRKSLSHGLLLFSGVDRCRAALDKIDEIAPGMDLERAVITVSSEAELTAVRLAVRSMCEQLGATRVNLQKAATIASELARNIVLYAGRGRIELVPIQRDPPAMQVRAVDQGPGIPNIDEILAGRYRSRTGLGKGLLGTKRLASRFDIQTGHAGTTVEAEVQL